jgi:hypothetical protein
VRTGWAVGRGCSALVYRALDAFLPEAIALRVLFAIGLLPPMFVVWITTVMLLLPETRGRSLASLDAELPATSPVASLARRVRSS